MDIYIVSINSTESTLYKSSLFNKGNKEGKGEECLVTELDSIKFVDYRKRPVALTDGDE